MNERLHNLWWHCGIHGDPPYCGPDIWHPDFPDQSVIRIQRAIAMVQWLVESLQDVLPCLDDSNSMSRPSQWIPVLKFLLHLKTDIK